MKITFSLGLFTSTASLVLLTSFSSCNLFSDNKPKPKTELEKLPPITQTGADTFGCLVNGKAFVVTDPYLLTAIYQGGFLQMGTGGIYFIVIDPFMVNHNYGLVDTIQSKAKYAKQIGYLNYCFYGFKDTYAGSITFSNIDKSDYIVSGTFEFSTVTQNCDTMKITNGRFDTHYIP